MAARQLRRPRATTTTTTSFIQPFQWFDVSSGWSTASNYEDAVAFCQARGDTLCTRDHYCHRGSVVGGAKPGESWVPYSGDGNNAWLQVGTIDTCEPHHEVGVRPAWGLQRVSKASRQYIACCGVVWTEATLVGDILSGFANMTSDHALGTVTQPMYTSVTGAMIRWQFKYLVGDCIVRGQGTSPVLKLNVNGVDTIVKTIDLASADYPSDVRCGGASTLYSPIQAESAAVLFDIGQSAELALVTTVGTRNIHVDITSLAIGWAKALFRDCKAIMDEWPGAHDGVHVIMPTAVAFRVHCSMRGLDGTGWTLIATGRSYCQVGCIPM